MDNCDDEEDAPISISQYNHLLQLINKQSSDVQKPSDPQGTSAYVAGTCLLSCSHST